MTPNLIIQSHMRGKPNSITVVYYLDIHPVLIGCAGQVICAEGSREGCVNCSCSMSMSAITRAKRLCISPPYVQQTISTTFYCASVRRRYLILLILWIVIYTIYLHISLFFFIKISVWKSLFILLTFEVLPYPIIPLSSITSRDMPKSDTLQTISTPTNTLRAARLQWMS